MKTIFEEEYIELITRLRTYRIQNDITQDRIAKALGVPQSFVSKVENMERRLDVIEFIHWIKALEVDPRSIFPTSFFGGN
ncbi:MAG: helix-turn-helix transcriptional regulator [Bacilli bacterium]|nr:helix-turn-helix transcriptional regulator [Bacilli bacterium]